MLENERYRETLEELHLQMLMLLSYKNGVNEIKRIDDKIKNSVNEIEGTEYTDEFSFFTYSSWAMYEAVICKAIKIFEDSSQVASFHYLYRCNPKELNILLCKYSTSYEEIDDLSKKIKLIRNRNYTHIDKKYVGKRKEVWDEAEIIGNDFNRIMDSIWKVLIELCEKEFNRPYSDLPYDGGDIEPLIDLARKNDIDV